MGVVGDGTQVYGAVHRLIAFMDVVERELGCEVLELCVDRRVEGEAEGLGFGEHPPEGDVAEATASVDTDPWRGSTAHIPVATDEPDLLDGLPGGGISGIWISSRSTERRRGISTMLSG